MKTYFVYILANTIRSVLYVGMTNDSPRRLYEHKNGLMDGFTKTYKVHDLVYFESTTSSIEAITREKQIKRWKREWKENLIRETNPDMRDLSGEVL